MVNYDMKNMSSNATVGGFPYLLNYLSIYLPYSILCFIGVLIGIAGNILIITAVVIHKELRKNSTCIMITNLAISDLAISLFVNSSTVVGVYAGKDFFDRNMAWCVFFAWSCLVSCGTSLVTMGLLAVNRYICIFYNNTYSRIFTVRNTLVCCSLAWIIAAALDVPNFFDVTGGHVYDAKTLSCLFDRLKVGYTIAFSVGCIIVPCVLIGFLYMRIFCHAFSIRTKAVDLEAKKKNASSYRSTVEAVKIAKSLFASFFIFSACWIPMGIIFLVDRDDILPISAHTFTNLPAHLNSAINPIFYGVFNPKIREGYRNLFRLTTCNKLFQQQVSDITFTRHSKQSRSRKIESVNFKIQTK